MSEFSSTATLSWDQFIEHGKKQTSLTIGMPWSFNVFEYPVTHENDSLYLIATKNGTLNFTPGKYLRYYWPSKEIKVLDSLDNDVVEDGFVTLKIPGADLLEVLNRNKEKRQNEVTFTISGNDLINAIENSKERRKNNPEN